MDGLDYALARYQIAVRVANELPDDSEDRVEVDVALCRATAHLADAIEKDAA